MSSSQYTFLERARLPTRQALQASIDALGFPLQLAPDLDLLKEGGFSPCILDGKPGTGIEVYVEPTAGLLSEHEVFDGIKELLAGKDACLSITWGTSMRDFTCAMIVSCALVKDFGAVTSYEGDPPEPLETLLATAREEIAASRKARSEG